MNEKRIKLTKSQKIALQLRSKEVQQAIELVRARQKVVRSTLNLTMTEQGVPKEELDQWKLTEDGQAIEMIEPKENKEKEE